MEPLLLFPSTLRWRCGESNTGFLVFFSSRVPIKKEAGRKVDQDSGVILHSAVNFVEHHGALEGCGDAQAAKTVL
jgi:hypothetical protein